MQNKYSATILIVLLLALSKAYASDYDNLVNKSVLYTTEKEIQLAKKELNSTTDHYTNRDGFSIKSAQLQIKKDEVKKIEEEFKLHHKRKSEVNCSPVDLRGPELGPVRDQGSIGWCFAYAAADLISYEMGSRVSARSVAQNYHKDAGFDNSKEFTSGGFIDKAVKSSLKNGVCLEKDLPSDNKFRYTTANKDEYQFNTSFVELEDLYSKFQPSTVDQLAEQFLSSKWLAEYNKRYGKSEKYYDNLKCKSKDILESTFSSFDFKDIEQIISQSTFNEYIMALFNKVCPESKQLKKEVAVESKWINKNSVKDQYDKLQELNDILDGKKGPARIVGIGYDSGLIKSQNNSFNKASHGGSIVARKQHPKTGKCMYLVRNSWGNTYKRSFDDENGNIWVEQDEFLENLANISYIKK